jgi:hypothetical protein
VKTKVDLDDHSKWNRIERDPALCEFHNEDVGILCGWLNYEKKSCVLVAHIDLLHVLVQELFLFRVRTNTKFKC